MLKLEIETRKQTKKRALNCNFILNGDNSPTKGYFKNYKKYKNSSQGKLVA